jgi:hypothetical protein
MLSSILRAVVILAAVTLCAPGRAANAVGLTFSRGDIFISLENGPILWRFSDGSPFRILAGTVPGTGEGMAFDAAGNLYVTRWCVDPFCGTPYGNTVEKFNTLGLSLGPVGSGYDCGPHAILFDALGYAYVGQAGCTGAVLRFPPDFSTPAEFPVAPDFAGSFWIDLAPDRCHVYYTSFGPNVKRYNLCTRTQLPDLNAAPLPGLAQDVRVLSDGGVLVSSGELIARLNSAGAVVRTYRIPGEPSLWAGLDLAGDGTFWAANYQSSNVYRFNLATGAVVHGFHVETPAHTVVAVRVKP